MNEKRYFQWLSIDRQGEIVLFDKVEQEDGQIYICFKDGSRCNEQFVLPINTTDYTGKLIAEIENPQNCWTFKKETVGRMEELYEMNADGVSVCVQEFNPGKTSMKLIPPRPSFSKFGVITNKPQTIDKPIEQPIVQAPVKEVDPVVLMISKSKKKDADISMNLTISLPTKELYNVIRENFDLGEESVLEYIISNISIDEIKASLKGALRSLYEEAEIKIN